MPLFDYKLAYKFSTSEGCFKAFFYYKRLNLLNFLTLRVFETDNYVTNIFLLYLYIGTAC
jgi:hypothetical protein